MGVAARWVRGWTIPSLHIYLFREWCITWNYCHCYCCCYVLVHGCDAAYVSAGPCLLITRPNDPMWDVDHGDSRPRRAGETPTCRSGGSVIRGIGKADGLVGSLLRVLSVLPPSSMPSIPAVPVASRGRGLARIDNAEFAAEQSFFLRLPLRSEQPRGRSGHECEKPPDSDGAVLGITSLLGS